MSKPAMILYDIVNPSDACTFLAPDRQIALVVTIFVGDGFYAGTPISRGDTALTDEERSSLDVPLFIAGISEPYDDWWKRNFSEEPAEAALSKRRAEVIAALRTVTYGDAERRRWCDRALAAIDDHAKRQAFIEQWEDENRSSLNAIMKRAHAWAAALEKEAA